MKEHSPTCCGKDTHHLQAAQLLRAEGQNIEPLLRLSGTFLEIFNFFHCKKTILAQGGLSKKEIQLNL